MLYKQDVSSDEKKKTFFLLFLRVLMDLLPEIKRLTGFRVR